MGKWYTDVWVKTNIPAMAQVRMPLTVEVESPLTVSPSVVSMGRIKTNEQTARRIIIRGAQPFRIKQVKGVDASAEVEFNNKLAREVHVLTVKIKPGMSGKLDRVLRVITDLKLDNEIDVSRSRRRFALTRPRSNRSFTLPRPDDPRSGRGFLRFTPGSRPLAPAPALAMYDI